MEYMLIDNIVALEPITWGIDTQHADYTQSQEGTE
jgi:hypothetical protein